MTHKVNGRELGIGGAVLLVILVPAITLYTTHIQTVAHVEHIQVDMVEAGEDIDELRTSVTALEVAVKGAAMRADRREKRTTNAIDALTEAVNMRRR